MVDELLPWLQNGKRKRDLTAGTLSGTNPQCEHANATRVLLEIRSFSLHVHVRVCVHVLVIFWVVSEEVNSRRGMILTEKDFRFDAEQAKREIGLSFFIDMKLVLSYLTQAMLFQNKSVLKHSTLTKKDLLP